MTPKQPAMPEAVKMPRPDDPEMVNAAKLKTMEEERKRRGRGATNLSGGQSGPSYQRTTLG